MKPVFCALLLAVCTAPASAHEIWAETAHTHGGDILKAELGSATSPN